MITRFALAAAMSGLLALTAFAQGGEREQAQSELDSAGVNIMIPEDATEDQLAQIIALASQHSDNATVMEAEVKKVLGME